jgi:ankyrin repeat protein
VDAPSPDGRSPLHTAAQHGHLRLVKFLHAELGAGVGLAFGCIATFSTMYVEMPAPSFGTLDGKFQSFI